MRTALAVLFLVMASPANGDWIVLKSGEKIATKGPWKERGRNVVFTVLADGKLASMPTAEVDLVASLKASAEGEKSLTYMDLGEAPDARRAERPPEVNSLLDWIRDPNAPRVSGTLSVPRLQRSQEDLIREGRRLMADRAGAARAIADEYDRVSDSFHDCMSLATNSAERDGCIRSKEAAMGAVNDRAQDTAAALRAAQSASSSESNAAAKSERASAAEESAAARAHEANVQKMKEEEAAASKKQKPPRS